MKEQDRTNNKGYSLIMSLAMLMSGLVLGIYVFSNLAIGIGLGFIFWISGKHLKKANKPFAKNKHNGQNAVIIV